MANYLFNYKGKYRILPELDKETNDFPRDDAGNMNQDDVGIYISCQYGNKIWYYGLNDSRRAILGAYIPSRQRGRNIKKEMKKQKIDFFGYDESDEEAIFYFPATEIESVATLLKAKTSGANISPFSVKNLPKAKVSIPSDELNKYKIISSKVDKKDMLMFRKWNSDFLENVLQKSIRKETKDKKFNWKVDAKKLQLSRQTKEYIFVKGKWKDYLEYLEKEINSYYNN